MYVTRYRDSQGEIHLGIIESGKLRGILPIAHASIHSLLKLRLGELRGVVENAVQVSQVEEPMGTVLAPIDGEMEVWAAGVTYKRSEEARREESDTPDIYARVYAAQRPELFFKANPRRVAGHNEPIVVRADSTWNVPEPELVLVVNAHAEIVGYTIGNDVSSRSIEGENPLYLPQAKVYAGCCALGPGITPAWQMSDPYALTIHMAIIRNDVVRWEGKTSTSELHRRLEELVSYLFLEDDYPDGVLLCTGTALVPESPFTLEAGDIVQINIDQLGTLRNPVIQGKASRNRV